MTPELASWRTAVASSDTVQVIELGTGTLTCEQIVAIARDGEQVTLAPAVAHSD